MLSKERLLHPATIIAVIALLVALSGAGYAATTIGTAQLKNNAVTTPKIKNAAVNTAKLKNNAVNASKLASGAVKQGPANGAVAVPSLANGCGGGRRSSPTARVTGVEDRAIDAVGPAERPTGVAVDGAELGNGSVRTRSSGRARSPAPRSPGGTIMAANIAPGQVVTGRANFLANDRASSPTTALNPAPGASTVPGVGELSRHVRLGAARRRSSSLNASGRSPRSAAGGVGGGRAVRHGGQPAGGERHGSQPRASRQSLTASALAARLPGQLPEAGMAGPDGHGAAPGRRRAGCIVTASAVTTGCTRRHTARHWPHAPARGALAMLPDAPTRAGAAHDRRGTRRAPLGPRYHPLTGLDRHVEPVLGRGQRAAPARVVRARRVVGVVEVEHQAAPSRPCRGRRP